MYYIILYCSIVSAIIINHTVNHTAATLLTNIEFSFNYVNIAASPVYLVVIVCKIISSHFNFLFYFGKLQTFSLVPQVTWYNNFKVVQKRVRIDA